MPFPTVSINAMCDQSDKNHLSGVVMPVLSKSNTIKSHSRSNSCSRSSAFTCVPSSSCSTSPASLDSHQKTLFLRRHPQHKHNKSTDDPIVPLENDVPSVLSARMADSVTHMKHMKLYRAVRHRPVKHIQLPALFNFTSSSHDNSSSSSHDVMEESRGVRTAPVTPLCHTRDLTPTSPIYSLSACSSPIPSSRHLYLSPQRRHRRLRQQRITSNCLALLANNDMIQAKNRYEMKQQQLQNEITAAEQPISYDQLYDSRFEFDVDSDYGNDTVMRSHAQISSRRRSKSASPSSVRPKPNKSCFLPPIV